MENKKIWLVSFPTWKYKEDVKDLARRAGLKLMDAKYSGTIDPARVVAEEQAPKLTLIPIKAKKA